MPIAIAVVVLVVLSVVFHFASPWYLTELASNWSTIDDTINITFWVCGFVFVAINLFMAYAIFRYRYNKNRRAEYEPENKKLEWWLTGVTTLGVAAMLTPGLWVWGEFVTVPEDAWEVEAIGQQWHWSYRLPGPDGKLGAVDARFVSDSNPFGMEADDPDGQDDILVANPELHLPINQPVKLLLRSKDVLHNFTVAQFRVKMDLVPGLVSYLWFEPTRTGAFEVLCEELCGIGHHTMRGMVVVDTKEDYEAWLAQQPSYAQLAAQQPGVAAHGEPLYAVCAACHGQQGEGNPALHAPKLAGQEAWYLRRQFGYFKSGVRGAHPQDEYGPSMVPMMATLTNEAAMANVIAYIQTFPDKPAPGTVAGNADHGGDAFVVCGACHGHRGEGIFALNAPRLAGMSDWYLLNQLQNFKEGARGRHARDLYGRQMAEMAAILHNEQAMRDVVAYINRLPIPDAQDLATQNRARQSITNKSGPPDPVLAEAKIATIATIATGSTSGYLDNGEE